MAKRKPQSEGVVEWADPPPRQRGAAPKWNQALLALKARVGTWARVATYKNAATARRSVQIAVRAAAARVGGRFEFTTRQADDGRGDVYARYLGD